MIPTPGTELKVNKWQRGTPTQSYMTVKPEVFPPIEGSPHICTVVTLPKPFESVLNRSITLESTILQTVHKTLAAIPIHGN